MKYFTYFICDTKKDRTKRRKRQIYHYNKRFQYLLIIYRPSRQKIRKDIVYLNITTNQPNWLTFIDHFTQQKQNIHDSHVHRTFTKINHMGYKTYLNTLWQIDGEKNGNSDRFYSLGSKITVDGDYSHEIKRCLLLGRNAMTNLYSILKSRDVTLLTKVHLVKAMIFPIVMYRREIWTIKEAKHWKIDAFELWCWKRLLRVPWTARRSNQPKGNQPWIFTGRTDAKTEAPILWPPDTKSWLIGKDPDAGKDWNTWWNSRDRRISSI